MRMMEIRYSRPMSWIEAPVVKFQNVGRKTLVWVKAHSWIAGIEYAEYKAKEPESKAETYEATDSEPLTKVHRKHGCLRC